MDRTTWSRCYERLDSLNSPARLDSELFLAEGIKIGVLVSVIVATLITARQPRDDQRVA